MKKLLSIITAATMTLALAACSSSATPDSQDTSQAVESKLVYGTATLSYAEFYSGDVSSTEHYDAVSSATTSKYEIMPNMATDFVDEATNANGYHITGVANVNVAVAEDAVDALMAVNDTFQIVEGEAPAQYKLATVADGKVTYSATVFNVVDTVTDATATLLTATNWGDYQINVTDDSAKHLRNSRDGEFDIDSNIQGIILETESGLKIGMEALQSIWVQTYEVSFNVLSDNSHNTRISGYDNLPELSKLVGETVVKITYIMPNETYVYEFDGIYIKLAYEEEVTSTTAEDYSEITLSKSDFSDFQNPALTVTYTVGSGHDAVAYTILETSLTDNTATFTMDVSELSSLEDQSGKYMATVSSDNYADIAVFVAASAGQKNALDALIQTGEAKLNEAANDNLKMTIESAKTMLATDAASSTEMSNMISSLSRLTADPQENGAEQKHG